MATEYPKHQHLKRQRNSEWGEAGDGKILKEYKAIFEMSTARKLASG